MKTKFTKRLLSWVMAAAMVISMLPISAMASGTGSDYVAQIGDTQYATLDEAIEAATDGATIELLADTTSEGFHLYKSLTIKGVDGKPTITFPNQGIFIQKDLTFQNCNVQMTGINQNFEGLAFMSVNVGATGTTTTLTLDNASMTLDGTGTPSGTHGIYFSNTAGMTLKNGALLDISNYSMNALTWDGGVGYLFNCDNSTYISDNNRSGFTGTFNVSITNSKVDVVNSTGNGSNGSNFIIENSIVNFNNNSSHGLSAGSLTIKNSVVNANKNGFTGITANQLIDIDSGSTVTVMENTAKGSGDASWTAHKAAFRIMSSGGQCTIAPGANVTIKNNYGAGIQVNTGATMVMNSGIVQNNGGKIEYAAEGGGVYNLGNFTMTSDVKLYNNQAPVAGDDIYNAEGATFTIVPVGNDWALEECDPDHLIDGWYFDGTENRWAVHNTESPYVEEFTNFVDGTATLSGLTALKAAHGLDPKDKTSYPGLDKQVSDKNEPDWTDGVNAAAGQDVNFKLTSNVPDDLLNYIIPDVDEPEVVEPVATNALVPVEDRGHYNLTFHDRMDEELDSNDDFTVFLDSNKNGMLDDGEKVLTATTDYTISYDVSHDGGTICDFEIEMDLVDLYEKGAITDKDIENATDIIVTYTATLDKNAPAGEYKNTAWVTYESGSSSEVIVTVETYGLNIFKYDQATSSNEGGPTGLAGAEFTLTKDGDEDFSKTLTSGQDGTVSLEGLDAGTYYLKETKAPEGYVCSDKVVTIIIPDQTGTDNMVNVNFANSQIPHTGGMGTTMFSIVGGALIATAGVIFVISRKKRARNAA